MSRSLRDCRDLLKTGFQVILSPFYGLLLGRLRSCNLDVRTEAILLFLKAIGADLPRLVQVQELVPLIRQRAQRQRRRRLTAPARRRLDAPLIEINGNPSRIGPIGSASRRG